MVSILCITYNQEEYIEDALKGFLNQKTNFKYELIISDDCSKDKTKDIILKYAKKYPNIIKPFFRKNNIGEVANFTETYQKCKGKYIALCDGDDYWTDPKKLQKQVDFLEKNSDYVMSSHAVKTIFEGVEEKDPFVKPLETSKLEDILNHGHFVPTLSMVFRRSALPKLPSWYKDLWVTDIPLVLLLTAYGKNYYFKEEMGLKRKNPCGVSQQSCRKEREYKEYMLSNKLFFFKKMNEFLDYKYKKLLNSKISEYYLAMVKIHNRKRRFDKGMISFFKSLYTSPTILIKIFNRYLSKKIEKENCN